MKTPALDIRLTLQRPARQDVGGGVTSTSWEDVATVWADLRPLSGREYFRAQQTQSSTSHTAILRQPVTDAGGNALRPTGAWRATKGSRVFEVTAVMDEDEQGFYWTLMLTEKVKREPEAGGEA